MFHFLTASTIFLSAYLLFFIQPLLAKSLLPVLGGSALVWLAGMLFFQGALLLGYGYAFLLTRYLKGRLQVFVHLLLLLLSFYFIPVKLYVLGAYLANGSQPFLILKLYASHILLPFALLSATSPLLQHWYWRIKQTPFPYYLYAISNAGSLIGLLGYPFLLEPLIGIQLQAKIWSWAYGLYAFATFIFLVVVFKLKHTCVPLQKLKIVASSVIKWVGLAFLGCTVFLATTQFLAQNIINLPLMWVFPLALYLLSFIVTFAKPKGYDRGFWMPCFLIWLILMMWLMLQGEWNGVNVVIVILLLQYSACMVCHGELIRLKPDASDLTIFYFFIALGGVLGGVVVNIIAPFFFTHWWDFYVPLLIISGIILFTYLKNPDDGAKNTLIMQLTLCIIGMSLTILSMDKEFRLGKTEVIENIRNPYGFIKVIENKKMKEPYRALMHGTIMHGLQYLQPEKQNWLTTYYGEQSGIGLAVQYLRETKKAPLRIGIIGLGTGTLAALSQKEDIVDFYEIDKDIKKLAQYYFTYLSGAKSKVQIIVEDGRLALKARPHGYYDLIVVDAFNGDAIPFHLLTKEAMSLYASKLKPQGIIALHTSNTYLNFIPVVKAQASALGCEERTIVNSADLSRKVFPATWALLSCDEGLFSWLKAEKAPFIDDKASKETFWTDDKNSILPLLKWRN